MSGFGGVHKPQFSGGPYAITSAGLLTIQHGFKKIPTIITLSLKCTIAEGGYSIGDICEGNFNNSSASDSTFNTLRKDDTNIYVRFSNKAKCFRIAHATTGEFSGLTNSFWGLTLEAEA